MDELSFEEQVRLMSQAAVVVGIHGADLTNCVFMQHGAAMIELNPWYWSDSRFLRACGTNGVHYLSYNEVDGSKKLDPFAHFPTL